MGKDTPSVPDPATTTATQAGYNTSTAQQQQAMNLINQVTPYGNLTYNQTGTTTTIGPNGEKISTPQYTATTSLSDAQQGILNSTQAAQGNLASLANTQSENLKNTLGTAFDYNPANDATKWAFDLGKQTILPQQQQDTEALQRQLLQRGLRPGTDQYNAEMTRLTNAQSQQLNQLALGGESQAFNEAAYERSQPLNELNSLISGSQVTQPTFASTPQTQVAGVDYSGNVNNAYNQQVSQSNAAMGGLFGLGGNILGAAITKYSDRRLKSHVRRIGTTKHGLPFYEYTIFGRRERGVMADEVEKIVPDAVIVQPNGFKTVNYSMLGIA